jgi:hypothetical protein
MSNLSKSQFEINQDYQVTWRVNQSLIWYNKRSIEVIRFLLCRQERQEGRVKSRLCVFKSCFKWNLLRVCQKVPQSTWVGRTRFEIQCQLSLQIFISCVSKGMFFHRYLIWLIWCLVFVVISSLCLLRFRDCLFSWFSFWEWVRSDDLSWFFIVNSVW